VSTQQQPFRIAIFTAVPPHRLSHFLRRLQTDLPHVAVAGVLYESERTPMPRKDRIKRLGRLVRDPVFIKYAVSKVLAQITSKPEVILHKALRLAHGVSSQPNSEAPGIEAIQRECEARGIGFHVTADFHRKASLAFVRELNADLGVIYGTRILKPKLFEIPVRGSINIHKHKVPDYRGGGAPGLWELRDGQTEQGITVHRVLKEVDAGAVLGTRVFPIDKYDTLNSVGLKADLVSIDCLIEVIGAESINASVETPQPGEGTVYKGYQQHQVWAIEREIERKRIAYRPANGRPLVKLAARTLAYPSLARKNREHATRADYPVVILFHHLISDRPKYMGLPTDQFLRHVRYLKRHYHIASLPEALEMLSKGRVPHPTVVLTFDDGYADNFHCMRAVTEVENVPVTLFISTEHISTGDSFEHDVARGEMDFPPLTWDQVRYLDTHGVTIASHTRRHFDCGTTDSPEVWHEQIVGSKEDLQRELGHDVPWFSFPKGFPQNMPEPAVRLALDTYPYVFSACGGVNTAPLKPGELIRRCSHPESLLELELMLQAVLEVNR
jgi:peptidoglycan/xylan/chitin deacetylase (PgdA/CDA1 family)/folate-dependent phosphoribosylglycinamide formyltransferase PurN